MTRQHLTPTTIVDKNGVTTTRLKKTAAQPSASKPVPAPQVASTRSPDEVQRAFDKLSYGDSQFTRAIREVLSKLSEENFVVYNALMDAPPTSSDLRGDRAQSAAAILSQPSSEHRWQLYGALVLAHGSSLRSALQLPLMTKLMEDERYEQKLKRLPTAGATFERQVCNIASAINKIMEAEKDTFSKNAFFWEKNEFLTNNGTMTTFRNPEVFEAMKAHPDHADAVADMFLERGNVDAADEVGAIADSLREGVL